MEKQKYYNSHGEFMTVREFINLEVHDRSNYTLSTAIQILASYGYDVEDYGVLNCIWVTPSEKVAKSYSKEPHPTAVEITIKKEGVLLHLFDDGDTGVLYISNKPKLKVTRGDFFDWYFSDMNLGSIVSTSELKSDLIGAGEFIITADELFDGCGHIPEDIVLNKEYYPTEHEAEPQDCIMRLSFDVTSL